MAATGIVGSASIARATASSAALSLRRRGWCSRMVFVARLWRGLDRHLVPMDRERNAHAGGARQETGVEGFDPVSVHGPALGHPGEKGFRVGRNAGVEPR